MVCASRGDDPPPHFKPMTNTELTLDQLQAVSGGFGAKMNRMVSTKDSDGVTSIECKVPRGYEAHKDSLIAVVIIAA